MPRMDGTGPNGMGSMTGGGFGRCNTSVNRNTPGRGQARGRCAGNRFAVLDSTSNMNAAEDKQQSSDIDSNLIIKNEELESLLKKAGEENALLLKENEKLKSLSSSKQVKKTK